jgi:hypothetical protein
MGELICDRRDALNRLLDILACAQLDQHFVDESQAGPRYVVPADNKWFAHTVIATVINALSLRM